MPETRATNLIKTVLRKIKAHRYGLTLFAFLAAAAITGMACVGFMRSFEFILERRLGFTSVGNWCWLTTPLLFLISSELIRRIAPCAAGTGIPQAIFAAKHLTSDTEGKLQPLFSVRTLIIKILSILIALSAGASLGREGPTVHVGICVFLLIIVFFAVSQELPSIFAPRLSPAGRPALPPRLTHHLPA